MTGFSQQLAEAVNHKRTPALVGLDPRAAQLPPPLQPTDDSPPAVAEAYRQFCRDILDVVAPLVPAVKPQAAFFEQLGPDGVAALADVVEYAKQLGLIVVLDAKRGDIGSTAEAYADAYLGANQHRWAAHALTVNPYLGADSMQPFLATAQQRQAGIFVLVKTSNAGSAMIQDLEVGGQTVYQRVAEYVEQAAAASARESHQPYGNVGAVVGATYPQLLTELRQAMPHAWILVPGYGSQGGTAQDAMRAVDTQGLGALINSSRNIIFAHQREQYAAISQRSWQQAVEQATRDMIQDLRSAAHE